MEHEGWLDKDKKFILQFQPQMVIDLDENSKIKQNFYNALKSKLKEKQQLNFD